MVLENPKNTAMSAVFLKAEITLSQGSGSWRSPIIMVDLH